jgi:5'-phosphate synthase pdxT subunit
MSTEPPVASASSPGPKESTAGWRADPRRPLVAVAPSVESAESAESAGQSPALVRQGNVLASCFHPELTADRRVHRLFAAMCA